MAPGMVQDFPNLVWAIGGYARRHRIIDFGSHDEGHEIKTVLRGREAREFGDGRAIPELQGLRNEYTCLSTRMVTLRPIFSS